VAQYAPSGRLKAYQQASHTVAKTRQVVMLYDGAIRFLNQAKEAMESGGIQGIETRYQKLTRVCEIISGLQSCLDFEAGQDAAKVLHSFYSSIEMRIFNLHHTPDPAACAVIIAELKEMRDVWDVIDRGKEAAAQAGGGSHSATDTIVVSA